MSEGGLRVELVFSDDADLDLYVTGPDLETVYFANTPTRSGGVLERDLRCDAEPGARVEVVAWSPAPRGRYRVGVDYPERCRKVRAPVPFTVIVETGGRRRELPGEISFGRFLPTVLEFDHGVPAGGADPPPSDDRSRPLP